VVLAMATVEESGGGRLLSFFLKTQIDSINSKIKVSGMTSNSVLLGNTRPSALKKPRIQANLF
jgi:hypothetical protein